MTSPGITTTMPHQNLNKQKKKRKEDIKIRNLVEREKDFSTLKEKTFQCDAIVWLKYTNMICIQKGSELM